MERQGEGEGLAIWLSSSDYRKGKCRPTAGRPQPEAPFTNETLQTTAASFLAARMK
jgi:hypothetical protein